MPRNYKTDLFQRRHYEWLASVLRNLPEDSVNVLDTRKVVVKAFANALTGTNPLFDRERFIKACQPTMGETEGQD